MEFLTKDVKARAERVYLSAAEFSVNPGFHRNLTTAPFVEASVQLELLNRGVVFEKHLEAIEAGLCGRLLFEHVIELSHRR